MFTKKQSKFIGILFAAIIFLTGCGVDKSKMVAIVDGEGISIEDFKKDFEMYESVYVQQFGEDFLEQEMAEGVTLRETLKQDVLNKLIMDELIKKDAESKNITFTDEELEEKKDEYIQGFGGEEQFRQYLEENELKEEDFEKDMETILINEKHRDAIMEDMEIEDKEVEEYFEEHKEELVKIRARHILVEEEEEAKKILEEIKEGSDFAKLAEEKSIDTNSAVKGGDLGFFPKGQMLEDFENAAFSLEEGEVSELVKTDVGYHIIKLEEKKDTLDSLKDEIELNIKSDRYMGVLEALNQKAKIEIIEDNLVFEEEKDDNKEENKKEENKMENKEENQEEKTEDKKDD